jgi:hypothetical protein
MMARDGVREDVGHEGLVGMLACTGYSTAKIHAIVAWRKIVFADREARRSQHHGGGSL